MKATNFFSDFGSSEGCVFDGARGIYVTPAVIKLAIDYGFECEEFTSDSTDSEILDNEFCYEIQEDAESYLSDLLPDDYYFGNFPDSGDSGIIKIVEED